MESEDIVKDDKYYEKDSYNKFDTFSVHGLNIEGIKRYYSIPTNEKYHHMIKLNKDLDEIISKHLIEKEERKKNYRSNVYDDERLIKMYAGKKEEEKTETKKVLKNKKPIKIQITNNNINKINTLNSRELTNINPSMSLTSTNKFITDKNIIKNRLLSKDKKTYKKNMCFSVRKFRKKLDIDKKLNLPFIKPREIIIEYQLTNDAGISKENKNLGHNHYMGSFYNPQNYFVNSKNRTKRNVFGGLFTN
jgi:glutamyl/glutaminyl-tRNA synthetase